MNGILNNLGKGTGMGARNWSRDKKGGALKCLMQSVNSQFDFLTFPYILQIQHTRHTYCRHDGNCLGIQCGDQTSLSKSKSKSMFKNLRELSTENEPFADWSIRSVTDLSALPIKVPKHSSPVLQQI